MYYGLVLLSTGMFSIQFLFQQKYEQECGSSGQAALNYALLTGIAGLVPAVLMSGFDFEFTLFSGAVAFAYALANIGYSYAAVKALESANLSVYSMFSMLGGMALPFIFGICCGEELKITMIVSFLMITVSLFLAIEKGRKENKAFLYYIGVFVLNGMVGVLSAFHQKMQDYNISSEGFLVWTKIFTILVCAALMKSGGKKKVKVQCSQKILLYAGGGAVINTIANLILLTALLYLPASVQFTLVTGGVIVFSSVIGFLTTGRRPSLKELAATGIAVAATVVLVL